MARPQPMLCLPSCRSMSDPLPCTRPRCPDNTPRRGHRMEDQSDSSADPPRSTRRRTTRQSRSSNAGRTGPSRPCSTRAYRLHSTPPDSTPRRPGNSIQGRAGPEGAGPVRPGSRWGSPRHSMGPCSSPAHPRRRNSARSQRHRGSTHQRRARPPRFRNGNTRTQEGCRWSQTSSSRHSTPNRQGDNRKETERYLAPHHCSRSSPR